VEVRGSEDGEVLWSYDTHAEDGGGWVYEVAPLPDVSGDGLPEVLAAVGSDGPGAGPRRIYAFDGATGAVRFVFTGPDAFLTVTAIDDVNDDGFADVIAGAGGNGDDDRVYAVSGASAGVASALWQFPTGGSVYSVDVIEDIDGDDVADVIAGSWSNTVTCLSGATGGEIWSSGVGSDVLRVETLGDVTGDGVSDVAVAGLSTTFRVLDGQTGSLHWFVPTGGNVWSVSSISDVSGDGVPDVIAGSQDHAVYCVSGADGTSLWTRSLGALVFSVRAIADVNGSGYDDVIAGTQLLGGVGGEIFCLEGAGVVVSAGETASAPRPLGFVGFAPNPLRGPGVFRFDGAAGSADVRIFDVSGRLVRRLDAALRGAGSEILWDGRSSAGAAAANGVYFYRVTTRPATGGVPTSVEGKLTVVN
jgi:outer membrane protein assembly factor BamB